MASRANSARVLDLKTLFYSIFRNFILKKNKNKNKISRSNVRHDLGLFFLEGLINLHVYKILGDTEKKTRKRKCSRRVSGDSDVAGGLRMLR